MPEESKRISVLIITQSAEIRARLRADLAAAPHLELREESAGSDTPPDVVLLDPVIAHSRRVELALQALQGCGI